MIAHTLFTSFLTFLTLFVSIIVLMNYLKSTKTKKLPPGPRKIPILGNFHQIGALPHRSLLEMSKTYGDLMFLQLGSVPTIVISSAEQARQMFKNHDIAISGRPENYVLKKLTYNYSNVVAVTYGDYWREVRKILVIELLTSRRVQMFRDIRVEEVNGMIERIMRTVKDRKPVDVSTEAFALANNIVSRVAFGVPAKFVGSGVEEVLNKVQELMAEFNVADFFPNLGWINRINGLDKRLDEASRDLDRVLTKIIDMHRDRTALDSEKEDAVDVLLRLQKDSSRTIQLKDEHLKGLIEDILVGGTDTSTATIIWTMTEIMRNPTVKEKALKEVREIANGKTRVEETDLPKLIYLKQVIKESFRHHPPAPLLVPRETTKSFIIDNKYEIPAKTRVIFNATAISMDPRAWENPKEFSPERFESSQIDYRGQHFELLPFGGGRRVCPGIDFSAPVVEMALANLLFCFDWNLPGGMTPDDVDVKEALGITVRKKTPLCLVASLHGE